jgi:hypothetical protein
MRKLSVLVLVPVLALAAPSFAQAAPASIQDVVTICAPVIEEEYKGIKDHFGTCVQATADFLATVSGSQTTGAKPSTAVADTVVALARLYRSELCPRNPTELPDAIRKASSFSTDADQQAQIEDIAKTIAACSATDTGAIVEQAPVPAAPIAGGGGDSGYGGGDGAASSSEVSGD